MKVSEAVHTDGAIPQGLPRLLYIGDVAIESTYHGSALLYRLLHRYPKNHLLVIEGGRSSLPQRRLEHAQYRALRLWYPLLLHTRFSPCYSSWLTLVARLRSNKLTTLTGGFTPEGVLTVTHGYAWITAATFARRYDLPLHLICHDDWPRVADVLGFTKASLDSIFKRVYQQAVTRLCVSPFMRDAYFRRYHVSGTVLYPSRAIDCPYFAAPPETSIRKEGPLTVAFAGNIYSPGYARAIRTFAKALQPIKGRLLIFGPNDSLQKCAFQQGHVTWCGSLTSNDLIRRLRSEADVLFVPMSFDPNDRANMESAFPSKLADYTAVGLPLLIQGPPYCSAVRWARQNPGVGEVVNSEQEGLSQALLRLMDASHRVEMGRRALEAGHKYFSNEGAFAEFCAALLQRGASS